MRYLAKEVIGSDVFKKRKGKTCSTQNVAFRSDVAHDEGAVLRNSSASNAAAVPNATVVSNDPISNYSAPNDAVPDDDSAFTENAASYVAIVSDADTKSPAATLLNADAAADAAAVPNGDASFECSCCF